MIIECSITNFRSFNKKQTFSMLASSAKSKPDNVFEIKLSNEDSVKLIKTAAIYGANASGKSNFIRALFELIKLIQFGSEIPIDLNIPAFEPFLFNTQAFNQPTEFEIIFITKEKNKYFYKIVFNKDEIVEEYLFDYPKKKKRIVFTRGKEKKKADNNIHVGKLGKDFGYKRYEIYKKLPLFSLFGKAENYHSIISSAYQSIINMPIWNSTNSKWISELINFIKAELQKPEKSAFLLKLEHLINFCDTQIQSLVIDINAKLKVEEIKDNNIKVRYNEVLFSKHKVFDKDKEVSSHDLPFKEESLGTNRLFAIGGVILQALEMGNTVFFDEFDASLHPHLSRLLVRLFHNTIINPDNAQLIFTTHEPNIMDKEMLRADQIWFTEKNKYGETELFSAQDFDGVREDIPFDKWYLAGKFGAVPNIKEIEFIFEDGKKKIK